MKRKLESLGFFENSKHNTKEYIHQYIKLRLEALGLIDENCDDDDDSNGFLTLAKSLIINYRERERQFKNYLCPADQRIQTFIKNYFKGMDVPEINIPSFTFTLDFYGIARELSLPEKRDEYDERVTGRPEDPVGRCDPRAQLLRLKRDLQLCAGTINARRMNDAGDRIGLALDFDSVAGRGGKSEMHFLEPRSDFVAVSEKDICIDHFCYP